MLYRYLLHVATLFFLCVIFEKSNCAEEPRRDTNAVIRPIDTPTWNHVMYREQLCNNPGVKVVDVGKTAERFGTCFVAAVTEQLGIFGKAPQLLPVSSSRDFHELKLLENYYNQVVNPMLNDLVVYTDNNLTAGHCGIVTAISEDDIYKTVVKSTFNTKPEKVEHFLFGFACADYPKAFFYRMKDVFENDKKCMLHRLQSGIRESKTIQSNIFKIRTLFFQLANGKNVTDPDFLPGEEEVPSLYAKIMYLLKSCMGLRVDTLNKSGQTALMLVAKRGDYEVASLLLSMNADLGLRDKDGNTALHLAMQNSKNDVASLLLQYKADHYVKNNAGESAVTPEQAEKLNFVWCEMLRALAVNHEQLPEQVKSNIKEILKDKGRRINLDMKVKDGLTLLMWAALFNNIEVAQLLLEKGADRNIRNYMGWTAHDLARGSKHPDMMQLLS